MTADAAALLAAMGYASVALYKHWIDCVFQAFEHGHAANRAVCETLIRGVRPGSEGELLGSLSQGLSCLVAEYAAEMDPSICTTEGSLSASRGAG